MPHERPVVRREPFPDKPYGLSVGLAFLTALAAPGIVVTRFEQLKASLHQIFVERVGDAETAARRPEMTRA